jgi:hypothetical protein
MAAEKLKNQSGQALMEFIIFLPFMLMLYTVVIILGDAIHGSINQQKATRGYFYYRIQNSAHITRPFRAGGAPVFTNWQTFGMFFLGWADYLENSANPVYPCYKLNLPFAAAAGDVCNSTYSGAVPTTQFIRVGTVYGLCGASYARSMNTTGASEYSEQPQSGNADELVTSVTGESSCLIN